MSERDAVGFLFVSAFFLYPSQFRRPFPTSFVSRTTNLKWFLTYLFYPSHLLLVPPPASASDEVILVPHRVAYSRTPTHEAT